MSRPIAPALAFAFAGLAAAAPASAAPEIANAWMRPAAAGAASADAYADVRTDAPLTLVAVRTPVARSVEIVVHDPKDQANPPRVVERLAMPAGETRFALKGSVLRFVELASAVAPSQRVPLVFEFVDASGARIVAETKVQVRGLVAAQPAGR